MVKKKSTDIWYILTIIPAVIVGYNIGVDLLTNEESTLITKIVISAIGGGIGALIWVLITKKSFVLKVITTCLFICTLFYCFTLVAKYSNELLTCEICGYKAVKRSEQECDVCTEDTWESFKEKEEYVSKEEWVKEGQLFEFSNKDSFEYFLYNPLIFEGYEKDTTWRPSIKYQDILK